MTDLDMTKLCAESMGLLAEKDGRVLIGLTPYDPLHDDAQAMALVKLFQLTIDRPDDDGDWGATFYGAEGDNPVCSCRKDLNRAIVECCAKIQAAKAK